MGIKRRMFIINGVEKAILFEPETDTLAETLRRCGYLGVKVGCGKGMCGACNVILNGELVRACVRKMDMVPEFSTIETIEGLGIATHLHPLQVAWIHRGGAQCGFCTPGFIVSAKALFDKNPDPTREEVRAWFQKNRNLCRCTGFKPLVDAVMDAADVMNGRKKIEEIMYDFDGEKDIYNSARPRPTALAKVLGQTEYGDDVRHHMPEGTLYGAMVMPMKYSHAKILSIDVSEAEAMPGVVKVVTAKDVKGTNRYTQPAPHPSASFAGNEAPIFCDEFINRYGDPVGLVVADSNEHARAAAKKVKVELEPLPEYMSFVEAVAPGAEPIYPSLQSNLIMQQPLVKGEDTRDVIDESYCSEDGSFFTPKEPHLSIEGDVVQAYYDEEGRVTIQCKTQMLAWGAGEIAEGIGVPMDKLRMIMNPSGGAFGWGCFLGECAIAATAMMAVDRPVSLTLSYEEFMHYTGKRTSNFINARLACDEAGKLTALEFDVGCDHGAIPSQALPELEALVRFLGYPYVTPNVRGLGRMANTNHIFATAYRGLGSPQCYTTFESLVDDLARKMGEDPFEFRYKNVARPGDLTNNSFPYREPSIAQLMDEMRPIYEELKKEIEGKETEDKAYGIGLACGGFMSSLGMIDRCEVALELNEDGTITHWNTWEDVGQGGDIGTLTHTVKALEPLGIRPDQVKMVMNDLGRCPDSGIAAASRCHFMVGNTTIEAANKLMDAMRKDDGTFRTYAEMKAEGIPTKYSAIYETMDKGGTFTDPFTGKGDPNTCMNYGIFLAQVEVDKKTGETQVLKYRVVADVGVIGNKLAVDGQAYGGISHTIGYALSEAYGIPEKSGTMVGAGIPYIKVIPDDIEVKYVENPREHGPHGSSGCSELFQSGGHMAVVNAIRDAVGVRIYELPASAEHVKAGMDALAAGKDLKPDKYLLGPDMFDIIDQALEAAAAPAE